MFSTNQEAISTREHPVLAYLDFLNGIESRDVHRTLARMSIEYGQDLRSMLLEPNFPAFFSLWCDIYPKQVNLIACTVRADRAIIETEGRVDGLVFSGHVVLDRIGSTWCVSAETHDEFAFPDPGKRRRGILQSVK
jgi:hypothetical protein